MLTAHSTQESESFDPDGWLSLAAACCLWPGAHKSHCINTSLAGTGDIGPQADSTIDSEVWNHMQGWALWLTPWGW